MIDGVNTEVIESHDAITVVEIPSERLIRLRTAAQLSQAGLAKLANVSQGTIGNIESGLRGYGKSIVSIAAALNVTPEYLRCDLGAVAAKSESPTQNSQLEHLSAPELRPALQVLASWLSKLDEPDRKAAAGYLDHMAIRPDDSEKMIERLVSLSGEIVTGQAERRSMTG